MNKNIKKILEKLETMGFKAYLVGGFVRDTLIGRETFDVDICTNALPKDLFSIFNADSNNYGGIHLQVSKYNVDITTFREDKNYINRRPSEVIYIDSLEQDLQRRDFTVNAICMDKNSKVIDLLNGVEDLNNRTIRMIGDIDTKLKDDPLRILRAIRFATVLDFNIDEELYQGLKNNYQLVLTLSKTRIKEELDKILISSNYMKGLTILKELGILELLDISYKDITYVQDVLGMWSQIDAKNMPFTNNEKKSIIKIAEVVSLGTINNETLFKYGLYINTIAGLILNVKLNDINKMYKNLAIKERKDINITSQEIISLLNLENGKKINDIYDDLISKILSNKLKNNNKDIKKYLQGK